MNKRLNEICERGGVQKRIASFVRDAVDADARTVELAFSSETDSVERWSGIEILGHGLGEVNLSRLNSGAPVLWNHDKSDQRGAVVRAWIGADRVGRALVRFSRSAAGDQLFQDVADGIVTKVSVGYSIEGLEDAGQREGVDVYRVTNWTPYEISMVSIPADDTVGVGRAMTSTPEHTRSLPTHGAGFSKSETANTITNTIDELFIAARTAPGDQAFTNDDGTVRGVHRQRAAAVRWDSMANTFLKPVPNVVGYHPVTPGLLPAGEEYSFQQGVLTASKAKQAGAHVFVLPEEQAVPMGSGLVGFKKIRTGLELLRPSLFAPVADNADVAETALRLAFAEADRATMGSHAACHRISRKQQRDHDGNIGGLAALAGAGLVFGVADLVDGILFRALVASDPAAFSIGAVAGKGLNFASDLVAVVGTNGDGATVDAMGQLRAAGVPAVLTDQIAETLIFAPRQVGVALADAMGLVATRANVNGDLVLSAFINAQPLVADPAAVWSVA